MIALANNTIGGLIDYAETQGVMIGLTNDGTRLHLQGEKPATELRIAIAANKESIVTAKTLYNRLDVGFLKTERDFRAGKLKPNHEQFWLDLLSQYQEATEAPITTG